MSMIHTAEIVAQHSDGGLGLSVAGEAVVCRPSGALWITGEQTLVVADLHLEKGSFFAARGQMLPPYDTAETLRRLAAEVEALAPRRLVFLGDTLHDRAAESRLTESDVITLQTMATGRSLVWVTGNHDPQAPANLAGEAASQLSVGRLRLTHEPLADAPAGDIAGHLHPCAKVAARGASVRRRCFVTDGERAILPAFGALTGGLNVLDRAYAGLFRRRPLAAVLGAGRVHAVGWASLRND